MVAVYESPGNRVSSLFAARSPSEGPATANANASQKDPISGLALDKPGQLLCTKASDGSIETIMVTDPEILGHLKVGDNVVITHAQALALSLKKES